MDTLLDMVKNLIENIKKKNRAEIYQQKLKKLKTENILKNQIKIISL